MDTYKITKQNGKVEYTVRKSDGVAIDMDIQPDVDSLEIYFDIEMPDSKKSFPDVKYMSIYEIAEKIQIPNSLLPNVRHVFAEASNDFVSGDMLMMNINSSYCGARKLLNTFCKKADDVIHMNYIQEIADYAFTGCESLKMEDCDNNITISEKAFVGSAYERQPFINGVKMAGPILIDVDKTADVVELPDDEIAISGFAVDVSDVEHIISHSRTFLKPTIKTFPKLVTIDAESGIAEASLRLIMQRWAGDKHIRKVDLTQKTADYLGIKMIDGIVYSKDMKRLIAVPADIDEVVIPDGVKEIGSSAFGNTNIKSVVISNSVEEIRDYAFSNCYSLESVKFGKGINRIKSFTFNGCKNLKSISIPRNVEVIECNAFSGSGLVDIKISNGLKRLSGEALSNTPLREIKLPASIEDYGNYAFGDRIEKIKMEKYVPGIICAASEKNDNVVILECNGKEVYIPRLNTRKRRTEFSTRLEEFFQDESQKFFSSYEFAYTKECRRALALLEYEKYNCNEAKEYLRKNAKDIVLGILNSTDKDWEYDNEAYGCGRETTLARILKAGVLSKNMLYKLIDDERINQFPAIKSYALEEIKKRGKKNEFRL